MDELLLPPLIEELLDPPDVADVEKPIMLVHSLSAKERESLEEQGMMGDGEKGQQKEEEMKEEPDREGGHQEVEELRAQMIQLLLELDATRDVSQKHKENLLELQAVLEEERLSRAHQADSFSCRVHTLQAQLRSVQEQMDVLEEEKDAELEQLEEELRSAQEDVEELQAAAAERENDIASLQEELCQLRAELRRLQLTAQEYELEATSLRAEVSVTSLAALRHGGGGERLLLALTDELQRLSDDHGRRSGRLQLLQPCDDAHPAVSPGGVAERAHADITLPQHPEDTPPLHVLTLQLQQAEEATQEVQRQCDWLKNELSDLQQLYEHSQRERAELEQQLQRCRAELHTLLDGKSQRRPRPPGPPTLSPPLIGMIVIVALMWCWWEELAS